MHFFHHLNSHKWKIIVLPIKLRGILYGGEKRVIQKIQNIFMKFGFYFFIFSPVYPIDTKNTH